MAKRTNHNGYAQALAAVAKAFPGAEGEEATPKDAGNNDKGKGKGQGLRDDQRCTVLKFPFEPEQMELFD